jgi:hypothetical protein
VGVSIADVRNTLKNEFGLVPIEGEAERCLGSDLRTRLCMYYACWEPSQIESVPRLVSKYRTVERELFVSLQLKYGEEPTLATLFKQRRTDGGLRMDFRLDDDDDDLFGGPTLSKAHGAKAPPPKAASMATTAAVAPAPAPRAEVDWDGRPAAKSDADLTPMQILEGHRVSLNEISPSWIPIRRSMSPPGRVTNDDFGLL